MLDHDQPITELTQDKFNRELFAKSLASTLCSNFYSSSLSIGLYGTWGSGKTSIINMILDNMK